MQKKQMSLLSNFHTVTGQPKEDQPSALNKLSYLANQLDSSDIIKLAEYAEHKKAQGEAICNLVIGDFDTTLFPLPLPLRQAIQQAYEEKHNDYPPLDGVDILREEIAKLTLEHFGIQYAATGEILVSGGTRPLIYSALLALVDPDDVILYPAPSWNNIYYATLCKAQGVAVETTKETLFLPTAASFTPHLHHARVLVLCSPLNPSGSMFSKQNLEEICDQVIAENKRRLGRQKPLYLLFDQVYWMLAEPTHYQPVMLRPELKDYVVIVDGASKAFAATGIRVGWAMGPRNIMTKMKLLIEHIGAVAPKAEQVATAMLFRQKELLHDYLSTFRKQILHSLHTLHLGIQAMKKEGLPVDSMEPMGGIYLSLQFRLQNMVTPEGECLQNTIEASVYLIDQAEFAVVPFTSFGTENDEWWFRAVVCAVSPTQIEAVLPKIRRAIKALRHQP